ncbi:hypothetical protein AMTRI_Chr01g130130 [Amborella trichopoda]
MAKNSLNGTIPSLLGKLEHVEVLDLSGNDLQEQIPKTFMNLEAMNMNYLMSLGHLDLSYDEMEGEVPDDGIFNLLSPHDLQLQGNILPACCNQAQATQKRAAHEEHSYKAMKTAILAIGLPIAMILLCAALIVLQRKRLRSGRPSSPQLKRECIRSHMKALCCNQMVLHLTQKSGKANHLLLKSWSPRQLVETLIFIFMPKGSLDKWLHPPTHLVMVSKNQNLHFSLNIIQELSNQFVHCDLKPSNMLLEQGIITYVDNFGLMRILNHGYIYNFGILLVEMFTGWRPINNMFATRLSLCEFVQPSLVAILGIGLLCSMESPRDQTNMRDNLKNMQDINNSILNLHLSNAKEAICNLSAAQAPYLLLVTPICEISRTQF